MSREDDLWDPNTWNWLDHQPVHRIYTNPHCDHWVLVDYVDYVWACKHRWRWKWSQHMVGRKGYAYRTGIGKDRKTFSIYLHVAIMERTGIIRPAWPVVLVDHRDGQTVNCRRHNLRWATPGMNRTNRNGSHSTHSFEET